VEKNEVLADPKKIASLAALVWILALAGCDREEEAPQVDEVPTAEVVAPPPTEAPEPKPPAPVYDPETLPEADLAEASLEEQRQAMLRRMRALEAIDDAQAGALEALLNGSKRMGQGNPAVTEHPMARTECLERRKAAGVKEVRYAVCGGPFMAPVYDPATQKEDDARVCVDRYEFPNLPCEYPMTWVSTAEAQSICKAVGKRLCDAHEWEGACAGALRPPEAEYAFGRERGHMRGLHNIDREIRWAYGERKDHSRCATASKKSPTCSSSGWKQCGSNTFPAGAFPECRSPFGVYDLHGNAAEHMNLPLKPEQLGSDGGFGVPEMKGSWFIFSQVEAHIDDCRWRAPAWHDNEGKNHSNYHLGFRCCKDVGTPAP
jgi:formylglycine-generating enzyme